MCIDEIILHFTLVQFWTHIISHRKVNAPIVYMQTAWPRVRQTQIQQDKSVYLFVGHITNMTRYLYKSINKVLGTRVVDTV